MTTQRLPPKLLLFPLVRRRGIALWWLEFWSTFCYWPII